MDELTAILSRKHTTPKETQRSLLDLKTAISTQSCPHKLRGKLWKLLLGVNTLSAASYIHLIELGPSALDEKIRNDTFRTMATDTSFLEHVSEDMLIRLLNAFVWTNEKANITYLQGMNVLAAPFLMVMSEMEAFFAFSKFIFRCCPLYVQPTMKGVHCGIRLFELCLRYLDPTLYGYLRGKNLSATVYAFAPIMTFSACTPPLLELLKLWDYMLACGTHLNVLFVIAQMALIRTDILQSQSPYKILRVLPPLRAKDIIKMTKSLCKALSPDLHQKLVDHAYNESIADSLGVAANSELDQGADEDLPAYLRIEQGF
ncbi:rab-GTPase-TBC domain-containing protein [Sporodiniella umbellata]|nr:rab-GTPase-TBC domain-containing protein [Sporodiniella umbellata]